MRSCCPAAQPSVWTPPVAPRRLCANRERYHFPVRAGVMCAFRSYRKQPSSTLRAVRPRTGAVPPDRDLGYAAACAVACHFALGSAGAGIGATTATVKGGVGLGQRTTRNDHAVAAIAVVMR